MERIGLVLDLWHPVLLHREREERDYMHTAKLQQVVGDLCLRDNHKFVVNHVSMKTLVQTQIPSKKLSQHRNVEYQRHLEHQWYQDILKAPTKNTKLSHQGH